MARKREYYIVKATSIRIREQSNSLVWLANKDRGIYKVKSGYKVTCQSC